jgi:hypothetical protein
MWQIVTLGSAACAEATPSPPFTAETSATGVGLDCLSPLHAKSASVTAHITDNRPAVRLLMIDLPCAHAFKAYPRGLAC